MTAIKTTKRDRWFLYNTLAGLVHNLEGLETTVDLRNEWSVKGMVESADGFMNMTLTDAVLTDTRGREHHFSNFFVQARNIRFVHIPDQVGAMVRMEYDNLARFLVEKKGYDSSLLAPMDSHLDFLRKGLILDMERGNLVQLTAEGKVQLASHGTRAMSKKEVEEAYGMGGEWDLGQRFVESMLEGFGGTLAQNLRCFSDYFDMPSALACMRLVDALDEKNGGPLTRYSFWPDVLEGLLDQFRREQFASGLGGYFGEMKANPDKYLRPCSSDLRAWLKKLHDHKTTFLITGSHVDFASHTATNTLGPDWHQLFDVVVFYARKPGFFTAKRPFLKVEDEKETHIVKGEDMKKGGWYSQGNWQDLQETLGRLTTSKDEGLPKCIYFGDHVGQDVFAPSKYTRCHTVAVLEEVGAEAPDGDKNYPDSKFLLSSQWGSYFIHGGGETLWARVVREGSQLCVPNLEVISEFPIEHRFPSFGGGRNRFGFYPHAPKSLHE